MRNMTRLVSRLGYGAIGVAAGLILAGGSGVAAVHISQAAATEHSIDAVQPASAIDDRVHPEDSSTRGTSGTSDSDDPAEPAESSPEPGDDNSSTVQTTDDSTQRSSSGGSAPRSPEPGDDHGHDGAR